MEEEKSQSFIVEYATPLAVLAGAVIIGVAIIISFGIPNYQMAMQAKSDAAPRVEVSIEDDEVLGDPEAPVTMIEFSDFQCPFCRSFWSQTFPQIKTKYIDTGKVRFVYRDFPLIALHPAAGPAAEAAECAGEQGLFWKMHDKIFSEQDKLGQGTIQFGEEEIYIWASDIGLDMEKFRECVDSQEMKTEVGQDLSDGLAAGIEGTPGFFINGVFIRGAMSLADFEKVIEAELALQAPWYKKIFQPKNRPKS